jgi:hypothetical protein
MVWEDMDPTCIYNSTLLVASQGVDRQVSSLSILHKKDGKRIWITSFVLKQNDIDFVKKKKKKKIFAMKHEVV